MLCEAVWIRQTKMNAKLHKKVRVLITFGEEIVRKTCGETERSEMGRSGMRS